MLQVATSAMANAVRHVTLERGLDPRDFTLVAYGGGGPLHAASVAKELSIGKIIIPSAKPVTLRCITRVLKAPKHFVARFFQHWKVLTPILPKVSV